MTFCGDISGDDFNIKRTGAETDCFGLTLTGTLGADDADGIVTIYQRTEGPAFVFLNIDVTGGELEAALQVVDEIRHAKRRGVETIARIRRALGAGLVVALGARFRIAVEDSLVGDLRCDIESDDAREAIETLWPEETPKMVLMAMRSGRIFEAGRCLGVVTSVFPSDELMRKFILDASGL